MNEKLAEDNDSKKNIRTFFFPIAFEVINRFDYYYTCNSWLH